MKYITYNNSTYKQSILNKNYYIDKEGNVYSFYKKSLLKPMIRKAHNKSYLYVDIYYDGKQHHVNIRKLVYETWVGKIPVGFQINHKDDNSFNNKLSNLYVGTQKENICDRDKNCHRVGEIKLLTVFDKSVNKTLTFCPASKFISYCGHSSKSGSVKKFFNKHWFNKRYIIVEFRNVKNLDELKSVTTIADECRQVE